MFDIDQVFQLMLWVQIFQMPTIRIKNIDYQKCFEIREVFHHAFICPYVEYINFILINNFKINNYI